MTDPLIPRLAQEKTKDVFFKEVQMQFFKGPKKPTMPKSFATIQVLPLKVLCEEVVLSCRAKEEDFEFIKISLTNDKVPECKGFNTQRTRHYVQSLKPKSKVVFTPLLDRTPSDPSTMLTTMASAARTTHEAGQSVTVFTADQQLYRVALDILWTYSRVPNNRPPPPPRLLIFRFFSTQDIFILSVNSHFHHSPS